MITEVRIRNLGVIADAVLEPHPGLTVLTGETGAGKTMVVTSLALLLGERAGAVVVRAGADRAVVEGRFAAGALPDSSRRALEESGGAIENDELLVARQVGARSRSFAGGAQTTVERLTEITSALIHIHGQSGQVGLARPGRQREVLDAFGGAELLGVRDRYHALFLTHRGNLDELAGLRADSQARAREIDLLGFGIAEIDAVAPEPGEDARLATEAARLTDVDELALAAQLASAALAGDDEPGSGAQAALAAAAAATRRLADSDATANDLADAAADLLAGVQDLGEDISRYAASLEADPARLSVVMERQAALATLKRKYGDDIDAVLAWREDSAAALARLAGGDDRVEELTALTAAEAAELAGLAAELTALRRAAAERLAAAAATELAALAMPHARVGFAITPAEAPGAWGADRIELMFAANPGAAPQPLAKSASGGELSRVRLALEAVLGAAAGRGGTLVFDEVDAGVGGQVGLEIGRRLAALAGDNQVVVVTHLAQVAAYADRHFVIEKSSAGEVTTSGLREVTGEHREAELARMMAGLAETGSARAHARDLLTAAARGRGS